MKSSSAVIKSVSLSVAIFLSLTSTLSAIAQSEAGAAARDYSFTISATQPWTDTGVDLQAGDNLDISAKARAGDSCDPEGTKAATPAAGATPSLLVATAPAGALIAKLQEQGQAVLVGSSRQLKADQPGHLFFGTNGGRTAWEQMAPAQTEQPRPRAVSRSRCMLPTPAVLRRQQFPVRL